MPRKPKARPAGKAKGKGRLALPDCRFTIPAATARALAKRLKLVITEESLNPLQGARITAKGGEVIVEATDWSLHLRARLAEAEIESEGSVLVVDHQLRDALAAAPAGSVVEVEGLPPEGKEPASVLVRIDSAEIELHGTDHAPDMKPYGIGEEGSAESWLEAAELHRVITRCTPFISSEEARYYLNGIYLHAEEAGALRAVATDGHRLGRSDCALLTGEVNEKIVPKRDCALLLDLLAPEARAAAARAKLEAQIGAEDDEAKRAKLEAKLEAIPPVHLRLRTAPQRFGGYAVEAPEFTVTANSIDGSFPDYSRVTPSESALKGRVCVNAAALHAAAARIMSGRAGGGNRERSRAVKLSVKQRALELSADRSGSTRHRDRRQVRAAVHWRRPPVLTKAGKPRADGAKEWPFSAEGVALEIGFNCAYLKEVLESTGLTGKALEGTDANVRFGFGSANDPAILERLDSEETLQIIMPMRV